MNAYHNLRLLFAVTAITLLISAPARASETDERIEASAKNSYVFKTYLKDDVVRVASKDGAVTLTGTVAQEEHKALAEETVSGLPGVNSVDNQIEIQNKSPDQGTDAWLSVKVKAALLFHRSVSAVKTQVYVKDSIVTLQGEASSQAEKDLAGEYARDIEGIKDVKNEMVVVQAEKQPEEKMGEKMDDASITAQVKLALLYHRSTSILHTHIETKEGEVLVTGKAKNQAEKDLVTKLVNDVSGVKKVTNNMEI